MIVFSDSHGQLGSARKALKAAGPVDLLLHAGDFYRDALALAQESSLPVVAVMGNCDGVYGGPAEELFLLEDHKVLLTHGHLKGDRTGGRLQQRAQEQGTVVITGHTHVAQMVTQEGILFFNPGSITRPRDGGRPSYGLLEIGEEGIAPSIHRLT
ncbi:MAG: YfcE family phosphodiesterase [Candidatus Syntrophopropionicum ammoniitolerans]